MSDPNKAGFEPAFQLEDQKNQSFSYSSDVTSSDPMSSAAQYETQMTGKLTLSPQAFFFKGCQPSLVFLITFTKNS